MKKLFYIFICMLFSIAGFSQNDSTSLRGVRTDVPSNSFSPLKHSDHLLPRKNAVYAEFLGNGFAYSLNYERQIYNDEKLAIGTRIGIAPGFITLFTGFGLPLEANVTFLRKNGHMAEAGTGFAWFYGKSKYRNEDREIVNTGFYNVCDVTLRIGYKYVGPKGFLFRAGFIPTFAVVSPPVVRNNNFFPFGKTFTPWAGLSLGYAFGK